MKVEDANCPRCDITTRIRHRPFSAQAISALLVWNEIAESVVGQAICDSCYDELREVLIERNEEINNPKPDVVETRKIKAPVKAEKAPARKPAAAAAKSAPAKSAVSKTSASAKKAEKTKEKEKPRGKKVRKAG